MIEMQRLKWRGGKPAVIFVDAAWAPENKAAVGRCLLLMYPCLAKSTQGTAIFTQLPPHDILLHAIHDIDLCYDQKWKVNLQV